MQWQMQQTYLTYQQFYPSFPPYNAPILPYETEESDASLYKTEMCRNWMARGSCRYGNKC